MPGLRLLAYLGLAWLLTTGWSLAQDRSPVDVVVSNDGRWLVTANEGTGSISLVNLTRGAVVEEKPLGDHPAALALEPRTGLILATTSYDGQLHRLSLAGGTLKVVASLHLGGEPVGIAVSPDNQRAYVALASRSEVAVVDLPALRERQRIAVGRWPRYLAVSPNGQRLAVGCNGDLAVAVVDLKRGAMDYLEDTGGINMGQMQVSRDNSLVYLPWMVYRQNPINVANIKKGWVLGSRIGRVRLDGSTRREAITLDPPGIAVADPHGFAVSRDESFMVTAASGTHELLVYRMRDQRFQSVGGPGDHIDPALLSDRNKFFRLPLGGRPLGLRLSPDERSVYVANWLDNSVQVVDLAERSVARTIDLGRADQPSLARQGAVIFYDGRRSLDQWYSCHSCHYRGEANAVAMDTKNDKTDRTFKTVPTLVNVGQTGPWTWHGWQTDLHSAMLTSMTETMLGPQPTDDDARALRAYLESLTAPPAERPETGGPLAASIERGKQVFASSKAGCANCHTGPYYTDGQVHDVGLGSPRDAFPGYNTPSLLGVSRRVRLLHDGRVKSLDDLLTGPHNPQQVTGQGELTPDERVDLIEFLKQL